MKDLKYVAAFSIPVTAIVALLLRGYWVFLTPVYAFLLVPILEILMPVRPENLSEKEIRSKDNNKLFNLLLYFNLPLVFTIVGYFLYSTLQANYTTAELTGLTICVGIVVGSNGINVAHELGHRKLHWEKTIGKLLLLPALNMHFYIEHNYGHHLHAATKEDPASAQYNQTVYSFWFTSVFRQYANAWRIQLSLLKTHNVSFFSYRNDMLWYTLIQTAYLALIWLICGFITCMIAVAIGIIAIALLETINYIEHYGLQRAKTKSGRYERVKEFHSWNSNHVLGRVMLYELTRHSDHHYKSFKKYQLLDYHKSSPQLPYGYPTSMVLSLFPPLWFAIMNKRIPMEMRP